MDGADIRALRKSRKLTLVEVARSLDRSVGWLSQVERDISTLSPDDARRMARSLGVAPSLLEPSDRTAPEEAGRIVRADRRRAIGFRLEGLVEELVSPDLTDPFEMIRAVFRAGSSMDVEVRRPTQEIGYVLSGRMDVTISGTTHSVGPGDSFRIREEPYRWAVPHEEDAVALWVISPPVY